MLLKSPGQFWGRWVFLYRHFSLRLLMSFADFELEWLHSLSLSYLDLWNALGKRIEEKPTAVLPLLCIISWTDPLFDVRIVETSKVRSLFRQVLLRWIWLSVIQLPYDFKELIRFKTENGWKYKYARLHESHETIIQRIQPIFTTDHNIYNTIWYSMGIVWYTAEMI